MEKRKIFIATHSNLSEGFKNVAKLIVGDMADNITTFSLYEGGSADYFREEIASYIEKHPNRESNWDTTCQGRPLTGCA